MAYSYIDFIIAISLLGTDKTAFDNIESEIYYRKEFKLLLALLTTIRKLPTYQFQFRLVWESKVLYGNQEVNLFVSGSSQSSCLASKMLCPSWTLV